MEPERGPGVYGLMRSTLALLTVALALFACTAAPGATPGPSPSAVSTSHTTAEPSPSPTPEPMAPTAVVKIEQVGGMLPPWETLKFYPSVVLYSDGRLIMQGPQMDLYPGPALPNLQVTHLTQQGIDQILVWAAEAGLQGPDRMLGEQIMDAGVTVFAITTPAGIHRTTVTSMGSDGAEIRALNQFQDILSTVRQWLGDDVLGDDEPYAFDRLRIVTVPADPQVDPMATIVAWPLDAPLATIGQPVSEGVDYRCAEISGDDLEQMLPLFEQSNQLTIWRSDAELYQLYLRPLLPDDEACPGI
ncbi:MAG: hypothetical protein ABIP53_02245 [Candidatus Limnocylindrales bacterium]